MTLPHTLACEYFDLLHRSSVAHQFARYALGLTYESLPGDVVHQAKRSVLDALGCAIAARQAPGRPICEALIRDLGGPEEATVFGSGLRASAPGATLVNSFLICFLDHNDVGGGGHNSAAVAGTLAVSEREKAGGRDFLTSLVVSYELGARVAEAIQAPSLEDRGWNYDLRAGLSMPPTLGRLMGLGEGQIANAVGICASHCLPLGILDCHREENTMAKNLTFGFAAYQAILACLLAKQGFTGPVRVVEGDSGIRQTILGGEMDLERMVDFSGWRILRTWHKTPRANPTLFWHASATLALVTEHDLKPEAIAAVKITTNPRVWNHTTPLAKKYPRNAESANHSAFFANAIAIKERSLGPGSFVPEKFTDPVVLDLIDRIAVEADPSLPKYAGVSEITTKDGRRLRQAAGIPHGVIDDPLTDGEIEEKFREMARGALPERQAGEIVQTVWNLQDLGDMRELAALMVFADGTSLR
jgi:2-methylcitrate dehydratase